ncbi:sensor histidine kinase [Sinosporangium siamense]|uniref:histidine kinase n=1 Tax=Sinosporangium siamense TaxID=1367973 RepID=A0A919RI99_9ACTN|nr:histidine kinase [Sinosporangium siamense]GII94390.1 two-component sensor histidine kinase [Sinosporangium siamense]
MSRLTAKWAEVLRIVSWVVACCMFVLNVGLLVNDFHMPPILVLPLAAACSVPIVICRRQPLAAWGLLYVGMLVTASLAAQPALLWPWLAIPSAVYLRALFVLGLRGPRRQSVGIWGLTMLGGLLTVTRGVSEEISGPVILQIVAVLTLIPLVVGDNLRTRRLAQAHAAEQEQISAVERARRELLEERARIAREMHDVVAHHMSVIAVQASSAPTRLGGVSAGAAREFDSIGSAARESLAEMRRLLGVLRSDDDSGPPRAPLPGLGQLDALVETARRAGTPVETAMSGLPAALPGVTELAVYRIVQEALSNVLRHAPGAATRVALTGNGTLLRVVVENDPRPGGGGEPMGAGHGLVGMRERADMLGGELLAGPTPKGGWRVEATVPVVSVEPERNQR